MRSYKISQLSKVVLAGVLARFAAVAVIGVVALAPRSAEAKPEFAAQTKLPCSKCHVTPAGGGRRTPFGEQFKANGYKLK